MYTCLEDSLKNRIAKDLALEYLAEYEEPLRLSPDMLEAILKTINFFRNVCAHEERLYNFRLQKPAKVGGLAKALGFDSSHLEQGNVFSAVAFLKLVLPKDDFISLKSQLENLFKQYEECFTSVSFQTIKQNMGFSDIWLSIL